MRLLPLFLLPSFLQPVAAGLPTETSCNPQQEGSKCSPVPAFAGKATYQPSNAQQLSDFWQLSSQLYEIDNDNNRVKLSAQTPGDAPALTTQKYIFFGRVSVELQAATGNGVVTTIILESDSGDEIRWELLGAYERQVQAKYVFTGNGIYNTYSYVFDVPASSSTSSAAHTYAIEWTDKHVSLLIDGVVRKMLYLGDIPPEKWPMTPMKVSIGLWTVVDEDEVEWAGGLPQWDGDDSAPFQAYLGNVEIEDFTGGCSEVDGDEDVTYSYDDSLHTWQDVVVNGCKRRKDPGMVAPLESTMWTAIPTTASGSVIASSRSGRLTTISNPTTTAVRSLSSDDNDDDTTGLATASVVPSATSEPEAPPLGEEAEQGGTDTKLKSPASLLGAVLVFCYYMLL